MQNLVEACALQKFRQVSPVIINMQQNQASLYFQGRKDFTVRLTTVHRSLLQNLTLGQPFRKIGQQQMTGASASRCFARSPSGLSHGDCSTVYVCTVSVQMRWHTPGQVLAIKQQTKRILWPQMHRQASRYPMRGLSTSL